MKSMISAGQGVVMKITTGILIAALLTGCATARETYTSDGRRGYSLNCSGLARNWGMCEEKAGEICGNRGYDILSASGGRDEVLTADRYGVYAGTVSHRTMLIACK